MAHSNHLRDLFAMIRRTARSENGSSTVEAVLWIPFFLAAFTFVMDATMILHNQSYMLRVVQDANRALSIGKFQSENEAEDYIEAALAGLTTNAVATTAILSGIITTSVRAPAADLDIMGMFTGLSSANINVRAQHLLEE